MFMYPDARGSYVQSCHLKSPMRGKVGICRDANSQQLRSDVQTSFRRLVDRVERKVRIEQNRAEQN
jgi:hypothetical protein